MKWRKISDDNLYPFEKAQYRVVVDAGVLETAIVQEIINEKGNYFSLFYFSNYKGNFKTLSLACNEAEKIIQSEKK